VNPDAISTELAMQATSLRRLAHDLLGDAHLAEDAVQDAMQAAIERPPRSRGALTAWLRTVVRRCALDLRRGEKRRRSRELLARSPNDTSHTHEQVELMQRVLAAVQALPEPYRTTVWLRYYEGRSPREIASLLREPVKTVKTRLWRALARLREVLDRRCGNRGAWIALMAPVGAAKQTAVLGALVMSAKTKLAFAGLLCAAIALALLVPKREDTSAGPHAGATAPVAAVANPPDRLPSTQAEALAVERVEASPGVPGPAVATPRTAHAHTVAIGGVVVDLEARPVPGVAITANGTRLVPVVITDADGRFDGTRGGSALLGVDDKHWIAVLQPNLLDRDEKHADLTIVVAPRICVGGVVVDTAGTPVQGAQIKVELGSQPRAQVFHVTDRSIDAEFWRMTPDDGSFAIDAPLGPKTVVHIEARGHRSIDVPAAEAKYRTHFVLERIVQGDTLEGVVVDEQDQPIARAVVWLHSWSVVTKPDGTFRIELWKALDLPPDTVPEITAAASNRLTGKIKALSPDWRRRSAWPADLRVRLGGVTESIRGKVLYHDDTPVADVIVTFAPPEPEQIRPTLFDTQHMVAAALASAWSPRGVPTGAFETARAVPGSYRLRVFDPLTLDLVVTDPIRTGSTDVVVRMPDSEHWPALRGVVVDRRGAPMPGAEWMVERNDATAGAKAPIRSEAHQANALGVIEHPPLARDVQTLCVRAAGLSEWVRIQLADLPRVDDFRVVVPIGCRVRIEVGPNWGDIDAVGFVDGAGNRSFVVVANGNATWGVPEIAIHAGRSETFLVLDDCVALLLLRDTQIVGRVPVSLLPGEMNVLRP
jgi:RNA polymerase sigma-70 factor (ECF subfamily)